MRGIEEMRAAVVEHGSPTRGWGRNAEPEKTHGGFGEDGAGHSDGSLNHDGLDDVRQNVANDDAQIAGAQSAGGFHEFAFAGGENLSTDEASVSNPSAERES